MSLKDLSPSLFVKKVETRLKNVIEEPSPDPSSLESDEEDVKQLPDLTDRRTRHERHKTVIGDVSGYGDGIILPLSSASSGDLSKGFLSRLSLQERKSIGDKRPSRVYDILPNDLKSQSFMMQFDMENPSNRFLLVHRAVVQSYGELSDADKREMIFVALSFVKRFEFIDSFLSIPLGNSNQVGIIYHTFYAHIIVSDVNHYMKLFREMSSKEAIPSWPEKGERWVTSLWVEGSKENPSFDSFKKSVVQNTSTYPNRDVILLSKRRVISHVPPLRTTVEPDKLCHDFEEVLSERHLAIGVYSFQFIRKSCDELERCQYFDYMYQRMEKYLRKHPRTNCAMRISLGSRIMLTHTTKVIGYIKFFAKIPSHFLEKKPASKTATSLSSGRERVSDTPFSVEVSPRVQRLRASPTFSTVSDSAVTRSRVQRLRSSSGDGIYLRSGVSGASGVSTSGGRFPPSVPPASLHSRSALVFDDISPRRHSSIATMGSGTVSKRKDEHRPEEVLNESDKGASAVNAENGKLSTAKKTMDKMTSKKDDFFGDIGKCCSDLVNRIKGALDIT